MRKEPPPRQIVILIDVSGSMGGWPLRKAQEIATALIARLRPVDTLEIIAFTAGAESLLAGQPMTEQGKDRAQRAIAGLRIGGGTDPEAALRLLAGRRYRECGMFFISDGEFAAVRARPDCETTAFAIGKSRGGISSALAEIADAIPVSDDDFNAAAIRIQFFDPVPRKNRFEPGRFTPIPGPDAFAGGWGTLPADPPPLAGTAVTHARDDAELAAVRPRPRDRVLAFRDQDAGTVGAFTTALPASYYGSSAGARAVTSWIERLLAQSARHRYGFALSARGAGIELRISLLATGAAVPRVDRLSATLEVPPEGDKWGVPGHGSMPIRLRPDPELEGVFAGFFTPPAVAEVTRAWLVLREIGPDALRRAQRVPLELPPPLPEGTVPSTAEGWSQGLNRSLLEAITAAGGGLLLDPDDDRALLLHDVGRLGRARPLRPWLLLAALSLYLVQIGLRRYLR